MRDSQGNGALGRRGVTNVAAVAFGSAALVGGLAFYMGWSYERAYINEWDLAFSAFSYSPYELMVASRLTIAMALLIPMSILTALVLFWGTGRINFPTWWLYVEFSVAVLASSGLIVGMAVASFQPEHANTAVFSSFVSMWIAALLLTPMHVFGSSRAAVFLSTLLIQGSILFVIIMPGLLGRGDAVLDRRDPERLPRVEVTLKEADELVIIRRVIRVNNGSFWLADEDTLEVLQIDADAISQVKYLPKK